MNNEQNATVSTVTLSPAPSAETLIAAAANTPRRAKNVIAKLTPYADAIKILRDEKGFSYPEIAEFVSTQGVETKALDVHRFFKSLGVTRVNTARETKPVEIVQKLKANKRKVKKAARKASVTTVAVNQ